MNIFFKVQALSIICIFYFSIESSAQQVKAKGTAKEPYASMSNSEKLDVQKKLIIKLKADTDFIAIEKSMKSVLDERRSQITNKNLQKSNFSKQQSEAERKTKIDVISRIFKLMIKYPELGQLDSETRKSILKQAATKKDI